ncbi:hypothetical protein [Thiomicrorhabdus aquaedulcis]|uniref:hypothetical protein n=1 Tax=Thiomicrorhabdus aquaedulcis TaxID=2211106 RepID=UPI001561CA8B|nr:hypothetical protein [Thiomicrorhabdus aquaedulcis]
MSYSYVSISFRSLPRIIREAIQQRVDESVFMEILNKPKYGLGVRKAAIHHYQKKNA